MRVFGVAEVRVAAIRIVELVFPLDDHAEVLVVQDQRLGGDAFNVGGGEFLDVHHERAVTVDVHNLLFRERDLARPAPQDNRTPSSRAPPRSGTCAGICICNIAPPTSGAGRRPVVMIASPLVSSSSNSIDVLRHDDLVHVAVQKLADVLRFRHFIGHAVTEWKLLSSTRRSGRAMALNGLPLTTLFSCCSAYLMSLTTGKCATLFLLISLGSTSIWTIVPCLANSLTLPVTRSSKRTPSANSKSDLSTAKLA